MKQFKKGDKVKYLGHPAVITAVDDRMGKTYYSVKYNKGTGLTAASFILSTDGTITELNEQRPFYQDTPNEFAYTDFKKWAYPKRGMIKKTLQKALADNRGDGTYLFLALWKIWYDWANKKAKAWSRIPNRGPDAVKFGRHLAIMMKKDNLVITRAGNKLTTVEGKLNEAKKWRPGDMWSKDFDYKGMLKWGSKVKEPNGVKEFKEMKAAAKSFTDVNYHTEAKHLYAAIEAVSAVNPPTWGPPSDKHLKAFNKACLKALKGLKEGKLTEQSKQEVLNLPKKAKPGTSIMVGRDRYSKMAGNNLWVNRMTNKTLTPQKFQVVLYKAYGTGEKIDIEESKLTEVNEAKVKGAIDKASIQHLALDYLKGTNTLTKISRKAYQNWLKTLKNSYTNKEAAATIIDLVTDAGLLPKISKSKHQFWMKDMLGEALTTTLGSMDLLYQYKLVEGKLNEAKFNIRNFLKMVDKAMIKHKDLIAKNPSKFTSMIEQEFINQGKRNRNAEISWKDVSAVQDKLDAAGIKGRNTSISYDHIARELEYDLDEGKLNEAQAMNMDTVPYNTIMKMKPGSTIKMKDGKIRTKDKFGNWRANTDPNDIIVNRDVVKYMKGMKGYNMGGGRIQIEGKVNEIKKGDYVMEPMGEFGIVNKVKGRVAYVKFDSNPGSFHPYEAAALVNTGKKHKGKDLYHEGKLTEAKKFDIDKLMQGAKEFFPRGWNSRSFKEKKIAVDLFKQTLKTTKDKEKYMKEEVALTEALSSSDIKKALITIKRYVKKLGRKADGEVTVVANNIAKILGWDDIKRKQLTSYLYKLNKGSKQLVFGEDKVSEMLDYMGAGGAPKTEATNLWKHFDAKMKLQDTIMDLEYDMKMINKDLSQLHKDMEQEAEPEGGPKATRYGREIEKKEKEYKKKKAEFKKLMAKLDRMEQY